MQGMLGTGGQHKSEEQLTTPRDTGPSAHETAVLKRVVAELLSIPSPPARIFLFGSRAREDFGRDSDFDVLGVWDGPTPDDSWLPKFPEGDVYSYDTALSWEDDDEFGAMVLAQCPTVELHPRWWVVRAAGQAH